jgi:hypothetical protein
VIVEIGGRRFQQARWRNSWEAMLLLVCLQRIHTPMVEYQLYFAKRLMYICEALHVFPVNMSMVFPCWEKYTSCIDKHLKTKCPKSSMKAHEWLFLCKNVINKNRKKRL